MTRREFLGTALAAGAAYGFCSHAAGGDAKRKFASDIIPLGKTRPSRLAIGTGTNGVGGSSNQTRQLGISGLAGLMRAAYEEGVTFWDGADQYGSHPHMREALKSVPREKVVILSKTHASTADEMRRDLDRFRKEIGTDYIDILLLHCMTSPNWPERKQGAMEVLSEAREKGLIGMHGVSCHSLAALERAAKTDWVQVDLARINPAGAQMDASPERVIPVLKEMKAKGKAVIGMKVFGAGDLMKRTDECLQFVLGLDCVDCFTIGCESLEQFRDVCRRIPEASLRV
jgi:1-deoxyxylulose-5-phosphate synthase